MNFSLMNDKILWLIWLPIAIWLMRYLAAKRAKRAMTRFSDERLLASLTDSVDYGKRKWKSVMVALGLLLLITALARPAWGKRKRIVKRYGRDVVFILDVSRSMLAADLNPNRLEHAKNAIRDCLNVLQGDRVGLVVFAGDVVVKCPLTTDYGFFRTMLNDATPDGIGRGGTKIGDAIRRCMNDVFDDRMRDVRDVVLITDGEDHDSFPIDAAAQLGEKGIRLIAIGMGDEVEGRRISIKNEQGEIEYVKDSDGKEVWSKMNAKILHEMVTNTPGGKYFNVATGTLDLGKIYLDLIASAKRERIKSEKTVKRRERFQIFIVAAFLILLAEPMIGDRKRRTAT